MDHIFTNWPENDYRYYLVHHGILKQQWGVRRYQNHEPQKELLNELD